MSPQEKRIRAGDTESVVVLSTRGNLAVTFPESICLEPYRIRVGRK